MSFVLRAHHIFCIQGFRGKGYSEEFVSNMKNVVDHLNKNQDINVKVLDSPDNICLSCPKNIGQSRIRRFQAGKTYNNRGFCENEEELNSLDNMILDILDIKSGSHYMYSDLLRKIKENLTKEKFEYICGDCKWYSLGYCSESLLL